MVTPSQEPSQVALPSTCGVRCHDAAPYLVAAPTGAEAKGPRLKHQLSSCCFSGIGLETLDGLGFGHIRLAALTRLLSLARD